MRYGSACSGIEAASVAWQPLGWELQWLAEIDPFCNALLAHHYQGVINYGNFTSITAAAPAIDLLVGGTPCQAFSVAGLRGGLDDARGNLALEYIRLVDRLRPRWVVWENVPGVLSSGRGRDFGAILGALGELGYGWSYRILDAQHFGIPQRRRRVFLVGYLGDWRAAAAVLFERESLRGNPKAGRRSREVVAALTADGVGTCGADDNQAQAGHLIARLEPDYLPTVAAPLVARQAKGCFTDPVNDNIIPVPIAFAWQQGSNPNGGRESIVRAGDYAGSVSATRQDAIAGGFGVRRLTPTECERLMGFADGYTLVPYRNKPATDSSRYRALGNSMAVPCMAWLGRRIQAVDDIMDNLSRKLEEAS